MSFQVSVSGSSLAELRTNMHHVLGALGSDGAGAPAVTEETAPVATRRQTKAEKEKAAALANGKDDSNIFAEAPPAPAAVAGKVYSKDDVNAAVQSVLNKLGGAETRKLLGKYGATSTGGVKTDDYAKLIAECEKLAA